jgi:hypothetical protein
VNRRVSVEDPVVTNRMWLGPARRHFSGRIVVGKDLMEL